MIIYVVQAYDGDFKSDVLYTTNRKQLKEHFDMCVFDNNFDEDFDIVGYEIPKDILKKYDKSPDSIYTEWIINKDNIKDVNDSVVFYQTWKKVVG